MAVYRFSSFAKLISWMSLFVSTISTNVRNITNVTNVTNITNIPNVTNVTRSIINDLRNTSILYGIVFDYPNASVSRTACDQVFSNVAGRVFIEYVRDIKRTTPWEILENGTMVVSKQRRHLRSTLCNIRWCNDYPQWYTNYGCGTCGTRRKMIEDKKYGATAMEHMTKMAGWEEHLRRNQQQSTAAANATANATATAENDLKYFSNCTKVKCDYDKQPTRRFFQGYKNDVVQTRGSRVAQAFYDEVSRIKHDECKALVSTFTHWIYPIYCI